MKRKISVFLVSSFLLICITALYSQPKNTTAHYNANGQFWISGLDKPDTTGIGNTYPKIAPFWGIFFWEYPDGFYEIYNYKDYNFDTEKFQKIASQPARPINWRKDSIPRVYITSFHSSEKPKNVPCVYNNKVINLPGIKSPKKVSSPKQMKEWVRVQTSTKREAVPGHEIRVVVSYKDRSKAGGTLVIFYNGSSGAGRLMDKPFDLKEPSKYFKEHPVNSLSREAFKRASDKVQKTWKEYKAFKVPAMKDEIQSFFFTLVPSSLLDPDETNAVLYLTAVWLPDSDQSDIYADDYEFKVQKAVDPNKMIGRKVAYRQCNCREKVEYEVQFENTGKGYADSVILEMPINDNFNGSTFQAISVNPTVQCMDCPNINCQYGNDCRNIPSLVVQTSPDLVILRYYKIGLLPKQGWFKRRYSKGSIGFSIYKEKGFERDKGMWSRILFPNAEPVTTNIAKTQWRQRALYLKPGYLFGLNQSVIPDSLGFKSNKFAAINMSISYQNTPIGRGLGWGGELGVARHRFIGDSTFIYFPDGTLHPFRGLFDITYLDISGILSYQTCSYFRLTSGAGIALPILANQFIQYTQSPIGKDNYLELNYGIFQKRAGRDPYLYYYHPDIGMSWQYGFEIGPLNSFSIGFENKFRYFPKFYPRASTVPENFKESETFINFNIYFRFKLPLRRCKC